MDQHGVWQRVKGSSVPDSLLWLISFFANTIVAAVFLFCAALGVICIGMKVAVDGFEAGLMTRYHTMQFSGSVAKFQRHWNYEVIGTTLLRGLFVAVLIALGSHELWLRRINDQALQHGRPWLKKAYRPRFLRCHTRWASICQAIRTSILVLSVLPPTFLAVFGAWIVEDNNNRAGLSFPLAALNTTLYYGNVVPKTSVDPKTTNFSSPGLLVDTVSLLQEKGLIHAANPPISYHALYPGDTLDMPEEMRTTGYYLPRSSFPSLESHLARSSRREMGTSETFRPGANKTTRGIRLGDAKYPFINTLGIGINMSSYERFMGDGMPGLPRESIFAAMLGQAYGNAINVQCLDITDEYELSSHESVLEGQLPIMNYNFSQKWSRIPGQQEHHNFTVPSPSAASPLIFSHLGLSGNEPLPMSFGLHHEYDTFRAGEQNQPFIFNNAPIHTLFILPDGRQAVNSSTNLAKISPLILKCIYLPSEFGIVFGALSEEVRKGAPKAGTVSTAGPLKFRDPRPDPDTNAKPIGPDGKPMEPPPAPSCVNPIYAIPAARAIHELLTTANPSEGDHNSRNTTAGGVLRDIMAEYYVRNPPRPGLGRWEHRNARFLKNSVIEPVFSVTGSAYFSLLRQRVEIANIWVPLDATGLKAKKLRKSSKSKVKNHDVMAGAADKAYMGSGDAISMDVAEDVLVKGVVFWILRLGGAAPYGLHWVGCLVLFWIGIRAMKAAWRTFMFGRGEARWGRWWEDSVVTPLPTKRPKGEGKGDEELGKREQLLGRYSDADGTEAAGSENDL